MRCFTSTWSAPAGFGATARCSPTCARRSGLSATARRARTRDRRTGTDARGAKPSTHIEKRFGSIAARAIRRPDSEGQGSASSGRRRPARPRRSLPRSGRPKSRPWRSGGEDNCRFRDLKTSCFSARPPVIEKKPRRDLPRGDTKDGRRPDPLNAPIPG